MGERLMADEKKKKYVAVRGMNLKCDDKEPQGTRIEAGDPIPPATRPEVINDLLANGDIKEAE